jgi:hypothetical protein
VEHTEFNNRNGLRSLELGDYVITIQIGAEVRRYEDVSEQWIAQQINRRREDGIPACVIVSIKEPFRNMTLQTPGCASGSGGRAPNEQERRIFDLWDKLGLNRVDFSGGNVIAFVKQLRM